MTKIIARLVLLLVLTLTAPAFGQEFEQVNTTSPQSLSNKTFVNPTIQSATITGTITGPVTISSATLPSPTITGTVGGGASYTGPTVTSPTITGTVSGGASYTAPTITSPTITNPTITGTVGGSASYTTPTLSSPTLTTPKQFHADWVTADNYADLPTAVSTIGVADKRLLILSNQVVSANITFPSTLALSIQGSGKITCSTAAVTITINGPFSADLRKVFALSGGCAVTFGPGATPMAFPQWWGGKDGIGTDSTAAFQAALNAHFTVYVPEGTYLLTSALTSSKLGQRIQGSGRSSILYPTHTGDILQVSGQDFAIDNVTVQIGASTNRTGRLIAPTNMLGKVTNITIIGAASINNGPMFGHLASAAGSWTYDHIRVIGGYTWTYFAKTMESSATIASTYFNDVIIYGTGTGFSDAAFIFDTLTDTVWLTNSQVPPDSGIPIHIRNSGAGQAPQWIHIENTRVESGFSGVEGVKISDGLAIKFINGYIATSTVGVNIVDGDNIDISHNTFVNIRQNAVHLAAAASNVDVSHNIFKDTGVQTTNTYDTILVDANAQDYSIIGNTFQQPHANKPRYGVNLVAGTGSAFRMLGNNFGLVAWGTAAVLNGATGLNQMVLANTSAGGTVLKDASGPALTVQGMNIQGGAGTPEGVIAAPVGSIFLRSNGGASTSFYVKETGTGNTGWIAK